MNTVYVRSRNQGFDPWQFIMELPRERIRQIHLAGHSDYGQYLIDTHDAPIAESVGHSTTRHWASSVRPQP